jgi:putative peptide zinc metalloprotease protein
VLTLARRRALLAGAVGLGMLPAPVLDALAARSVEERLPAGTLLVADRGEWDRIYVIAEGRAVVTVADGAGGSPPVALGTATVGELVGGIALLAPNHHRPTATVTALTSLVVLGLDEQVVLEALTAHPDARAELERVAEELVVASFLKQATPFAGLSAQQVRALAGRLQRLTLPTGIAVFRQGEPGDRCYLLRSGRVEVLIAGDDSAERTIATLRPGALFGEAALLTGLPRNATVRVLEPSELLALHRADLEEVMWEDRATAAQIVQVWQIRGRPRQATGVMAEHQTTADRETLTILKDPARGSYFRLTAEGWFLWERLDGQHTLRDLTMAYLLEFKSLAPQIVADVVGGLAAAGFLEEPSLRRWVLTDVAHLTRWERMILRARRLIEWRVALPNADAWFERAYRSGAFLLYTRVGLLLLSLIALAGLAVFLSAGRGAAAEVSGEHLAVLLPLLLPMRWASVIVHEAGHAFATKRFDRSVGSAGVGWYWFAPIAFVDTSDMWLGTRRQRIMVSLAGSFHDVVLAGVASILGLLVAEPLLAALCWQFAFLAYLGVLVNLTPLLELDGYYVLVDLLDRPNLRPRALAWLGQELLPTLRSRGVAGLRGHYTELVYGTASLLYIGFMAYAVTLLYRLTLESWVATVLPAPVAAGLAWAAAAVVVGAVGLSVAGDLRGMRRPAVLRT